MPVFDVRHSIKYRNQYRHVCIPGRTDFSTFDISQTRELKPPLTLLLCPRGQPDNLETPALRISFTAANVIYILGSILITAITPSPITRPMLTLCGGSPFFSV